MKYREGAVIEALERVSPFLADHREQLARDNPAEFDRALQRVEEVLAQLRAYGVEQDKGRRGAQGETALQRKLRLELRSQWLRPIATIARRNTDKLPGLEALHMPDPSERGRAFLTSARAMV